MAIAHIAILLVTGTGVGVTSSLLGYRWLLHYDPGSAYYLYQHEHSYRNSYKAGIWRTLAGCFSALTSLSAEVYIYCPHVLYGDRDG